MSISNLFTTNDYDLYCRSITTQNVGPGSSKSIGLSTVSQVCPSGVNTPITWATILWQDTLLFQKTSGTEITVLLDGYYLIEAYVPFEQNASAGFRSIAIKVGAAVTNNGARVNTANTDFPEKLNISTVRQLNAGSVISCIAAQSSIAACTLGSTAGTLSEIMLLTITRLN